MMHLKEVPEKYQHNLDIGEKKFAVKPYVREAVHTARQDLIHDDYPTGFDVIVCRNVIKFFDPMVILKVQARLAASLNEGGFLFVSTDDDHASLELIDDPQSLGLVRLEGRPIYQKRAR